MDFSTTVLSCTYKTFEFTQRTGLDRRLLPLLYFQLDPTFLFQLDGCFGFSLFHSTCNDLGCQRQFVDETYVLDTHHH